MDRCEIETQVIGVLFSIRVTLWGVLKIEIITVRI